MPADLYAELGLDPAADADEIRTAYLALMRRHHPDFHPGDEGSADAARRINAAYEILGDPRRRLAYDRRRTPTRTRPITAPAPHRPHAYSQERATFRATFLGATLRFAGALLALGMVLLLAFAAQ
jgi:DnaJ-class molecular chaperone